MKTELGQSLNKHNLGFHSVLHSKVCQPINDIPYSIRQSSDHSILVNFDVFLALSYRSWFEFWSSRIKYVSRLKRLQFLFEIFKDHIKQVRIISIITRFNHNTGFCCFVKLRCVTDWPTLSFSQGKISSLLKGRKISKETKVHIPRYI